VDIRNLRRERCRGRILRWVVRYRRRADHGPGAGVRIHNDRHRARARRRNGARHIDGGDRVLGRAERLRHYCKDSASIEIIRKAAPWVVVGVVIGGIIASRTPALPLLIFVGGFQLFAAVLMLIDVSKLTMLQALARKNVALRLFSIVFGGIAALAGIGGGTLFTPYFKASGMEPKLAIGTSAAIGLPVSLAGAVAYGWEGYGMDLCRWAIGYINLPALVALVLGTLMTVRLGVAVAHRLPSRALASAFAVFLVLNGGHLLYSALATSHAAAAADHAPPMLDAPNARVGSARVSLAD
jgi:uncharacterized membrane protein YfcA